MKNYFSNIAMGILTIICLGSIVIDLNKEKEKLSFEGVEIVNWFSENPSLIPQLIDVPVKKEIHQERVLAIKKWKVDNHIAMIIYTNQRQQLVAVTESLSLILDTKNERIIKANIEGKFLLDEKIGNTINIVTHNNIVTDILPKNTIAKIL